MNFVWFAIGSALGGVARYAITRWTLAISAQLPWGTVLINVLGCFLIGFFGTYTLAGGRHEVSANTRLFVMVGLCGGFPPLSYFSLHTFDLVRCAGRAAPDAGRGGAWGRACANVVLSVVLCFAAVAAGHLVAHHAVPRAAIAQTDQEEGMEA